MLAILLSCAGSPPPAPEAAPPAAPPAAAPPAEAPPEARCGETPPANDAPWTTATAEDALPGFSDFPSCPVVLGDFDADGAGDVAVLEVNHTERRSRLRLVLADGTSLIATTWPAVPASMGGVVPTLVSPKPASEDVARDNISAEARAGLAGRDAVETCHTEGDTLPSADIGDLCYCSDFWIVVDGAAVSHLVCD